MTFQIETGVPVPARASGRRGGKYPFADMDVGDSFLVEGEVKPATVRSAVGAFAKRYPDFGKFAVRATEDGLRVWRTV